MTSAAVPTSSATSETSGTSGISGISGTFISSATSTTLATQTSEEFQLEQLQRMLHGQGKRHYPREYKLGVIAFWKEAERQGKSRLGVAKLLNISEPALSKWIRNESNIISSREVQSLAFLPEMEEYLHQQFLILRQQGAKIDRAWFIAEAKKWYEEHFPERMLMHMRTKMDIYDDFKLSPNWFFRFKLRKGITLRTPTKHTQEVPENANANVPANAKDRIQSFHNFIRYHASQYEKYNSPPHDVGVYKLGNIANMDQISLEFDFLSERIYDTNCAETVLVQGGSDNRLATIQATIFGDGKTRVKPLLVFRGKGTWVPIASKQKPIWDDRVVVDFQEDARVDERIMIRWLQNQWQQAIDLTSIAGKMVARNNIPRMLVMDVQKAQQTTSVQELFDRLNTLPVMVPSGCTSLVHPLDVCVNKPFKDRIHMLADQHYQAHFYEWRTRRFNAADRRILVSQWVGAAWEAIHQELQPTIRSAFQKCGITVNIDGSEDHLIDIHGLSDYTVGSSIDLPIESDSASDSELTIYSDSDFELDDRT